MRNLDFKHVEGGAAITVRVTPRAPKNQISGIMANGIVKIRLNAPPVDGKANQALIHFLSEVLEIKESNIQIVAGDTSRTKIISFIGINGQALNDRILAIADSN